METQENLPTMQTQNMALCFPKNILDFKLTMANMLNQKPGNHPLAIFAE